MKVEVKVTRVITVVNTLEVTAQDYDLPEDALEDDILMAIEQQECDQCLDDIDLSSATYTVKVEIV